MCGVGELSETQWRRKGEKIKKITKGLEAVRALDRFC